MVNHWWNGQTPEVTACGEYEGSVVPHISTDYQDASCPECEARCVLCYGKDRSCTGPSPEPLRLDAATGSVFLTHDSGERMDYPSGMRRDLDKGKLRFDLIPLFMLKRVAGLYTRGAEKYGDDNWQLADSEEEYTRFRASAFRHFVAWMDGERDEDHGAAVFFNIAAAEYVRMKLDAS